MNIKLIVTIASLLLLTSCQTNTEANLPPDTLIVDCSIPKPPARAMYKNANWQKREELLLEVISKQYSSMRKCNIRLAALRKWKASQIERYKGKYNGK